MSDNVYDSLAETHEDGAWVREAAAAYAEKHARRTEEVA